MPSIQEISGFHPQQKKEREGKEEGKRREGIGRKEGRKASKTKKYLAIDIM